MKISTKKPKQRREIRGEEQEEKQKEKLHKIILKKLKRRSRWICGMRTQDTAEMITVRAAMALMMRRRFDKYQEPLNTDNVVY